MKQNIALIKTETYAYPGSKAFRPSEAFPEYLFKQDISEEPNQVYPMLREGLRLLGYDREHYGTEAWNPLGKLIAPGDHVVVKPNMVMDVNPSGEGTDCLYTHPSVVAAVVDYVLIALKGKGKIIIGDAPMQECNFERLVSESGYRELCRFYKKRVQGVKISLEDFRELRTVVKNGVYHSKVSSDKGIVVDLKEESEFAGRSDAFYSRLRVTNYDPAILKMHHSREKNEYYVNRAILNADVIINMPKPKTHRKAGVTIALKNLVGINARKEYLPHHTIGSKAEGGDEYLRPSLLKRAEAGLLDRKNYFAQTKRAYKRAWLLSVVIKAIHLCLRISDRERYHEGSWYGNDTISRTIVDLNKILFYADKAGNLQRVKQRTYLIVADMILSGEGEGPVRPSEKKVGMIAIGENPVCFDEAVAVLMGAKTEWIHTLTHARNVRGAYELAGKEDIPWILSNDKRWDNKTAGEIKTEDILYFKPAAGWERAFKNWQ